MDIYILADAPSPDNSARVRLMKTAFEALGATVHIKRPVMALRTWQFIAIWSTPAATVDLPTIEGALRSTTIVVHVTDELRGSDYGGPPLEMVERWSHDNGVPLIVVAEFCYTSEETLHGDGIAAAYEVRTAEDASAVAAAWSIPARGL